MQPVSSYWIDGKMRVVDHGPITLERALRVIEAYIQQYRGVWEHFEDALAETRFGFSQDEGIFIEIDVFLPTEFGVRSETPTGERDINVPTENDVRRIVERFFEDTPEDFRKYFASIRSSS